MTQEELFQAKSPSIQPFIQPLFCAIPRETKLTPLVEGRNFETSRFFDDNEATPIRGTPAALRQCTTDNDTISSETIAEFLSLSRKYLGLDLY